MAIILCIETATSVCSVAIARDHTLIASRESHKKNAHASLVSVFIDETIKEAGLKFEDIDAVAVSKGPGSYTGLRIGVSTAKGLCYALNIPMIAISTPRSMAAGMIEYLKKEQDNPDLSTLVCPMIDARRMEVYSAIYTMDNEEIRKIEADIIESVSFEEYLQKSPVYFFGDGAEKCKETLSHQPNAHFNEFVFPSALHMIDLAFERFHSKQFVDVAYFEPFYLKDFVAGKPRVKGLR